eukprot:403337826
MNNQFINNRNDYRKNSSEDDEDIQIVGGRGINMISQKSKPIHKVPDQQVRSGISTRRGSNLINKHVNGKATVGKYGLKSRGFEGDLGSLLNDEGKAKSQEQSSNDFEMSLDDFNFRVQQRSVQEGQQNKRNQKPQQQNDNKDNQMPEHHFQLKIVTEIFGSNEANYPISVRDDSILNIVERIRQSHLKQCKLSRSAYAEVNFIFVLQNKKDANDIQILDENSEQIRKNHKTILTIYDLIIYIPVYKEKDYYENCSQIIIQQNQDVRKPFQRALEEIMRDTKKTDWKNNREQLIQNMLLAEEGYGGKSNAYDVETKTRYFIQQIIFEAIKELKIYRLEEEQQNKTFSQKKIIPDMVICKRDQEINSNGQNHQKAGKIECGKKTLFVIEIKKPLSKNGQENPQDLIHIDRMIQQNLNQLRHFCIQSGQSQVYGIVTNFKEWYFTKFDLLKEIVSVISQNNQRNSQQQKQNANNQNKKFQQGVHEPFEISQKIQLMGIDEGIEKLNRLELAKVIQIIQWLENIELLQQ